MKAAEAIVKGLLARGEREVTLNSASRFRKFTRSYMGQRNADGTLNPVQREHAGNFWFVSIHNGSLRVGRTSAESRQVKKAVRDVIIQEGKV